MTGLVTLSIGGPENYVIDEFETTASDHSVQISTTDTQGCIIFKLGSNSGTNSCVEVVDSNDAQIAKVSADKSIEYQGDVSVAGVLCPSVLEHTVFSTMSFGNEKDECTFDGDRPNYMLLNLVDLCGANGILKYNTMRIFVYDPQASRTYNIQGAIYKLDTAGGAVPGDVTTYNNSTRVGITNDVSWTDSSGSAGTGDGFVDLTFTATNTIQQYTGNTQNYYFFAIRVDNDGGNNLHCYGTRDVGNPSRGRENWAYFGSTQETSGLGLVMQNVRDGTQGVCPYCTIFYKS